MSILSILPLSTRLYLLFLAAISGLVLGSGLNCLAWRMVQGERWKSGQSHCPHCGHTLHLPDLIPLLSYLFLKGRCRYCGEKISPRYAAAELSLAVIFVSLLLRYDFSLETLELMALCCCLFCLSLVDLDSQIIPDRFLVLGILIRLAYLLVAEPGIAPLWYALWHGLLLGGMILALSLVMDKVLGKDSMGGGDIKLLFVLGLYFDLPNCLLLLILACITGIFLALLLGAKKDIAFPFGPALAVSAWLTLLFGSPLTQWYMSLF